jgi:hypothetical protein
MDAPPRGVTTPIVIFSFDRPHYLRRFCQSLRAQQGVVLNERRIYLVQDGAVSPRTGVRYAEDAVLAESAAAFREVFPRGQVLASRDNHGIAFNIRRGEALVFEALDAELGYFFEDDLELGPAYLLAMERLREAVADRPEVGYFAAYGEHRQPADPAAPKYIGLDHHWGFALRRQAWLRISQWLRPYFAILAEADYQHRDHAAIFRFLQGQEMAMDRSSQDTLKAVASAACGVLRVMTDIGFARYIGERGASFNPDRYRQLGYDRMAPLERTDISLPTLSAARAQQLLLTQQAHFRRFRQQEFDGFLARYAARNWPLERPVERADVDDLYRLLLDRLPESEQAYADNVGVRSLRTLRQIIVNSREYRARHPR